MTEVVRILLRDEFSAQLKEFENKIRGVARSVEMRNVQSQFKAIEGVASFGRREFNSLLTITGVTTLVSGTIVGTLAAISRQLQRVSGDALQTQYTADALEVSVERFRDLSNRLVALGVERGQAESQLERFYQSLQKLKRLRQGAPVAKELQEAAGGGQFVDAVNRALDAGGYDAAIELIVKRSKEIKNNYDRQFFWQAWQLDPRFAEIFGEQFAQVRKSIELNRPAMIAFRWAYINMVTTVQNVGARVGNAFLPIFTRMMTQFDQWLQTEPGQEFLKRVEEFAKYLEGLPWEQIEKDIREFFSALKDIIVGTAGYIVDADNKLKGLGEPTAYEKAAVWGLITWLALTAGGLKKLGLFAGVMVTLTGIALSVKGAAQGEGQAAKPEGEGGEGKPKEPGTNEGDRRVAPQAPSMQPLQFAGAGGGMAAALGAGLPDFDETIRLQQGLQGQARAFSQEDQFTTRELSQIVEITTNELNRLNDFLAEQQLAEIMGKPTRFAAGAGGGRSRLGQLLGVSGGPSGPQYAALPPGGGVGGGGGGAGRGGGVLAPPTEVTRPPGSVSVPTSPAQAAQTLEEAYQRGFIPRPPAGAVAPGLTTYGGAAGIPGLAGGPSGPAATRAPGAGGSGSGGVPSPPTIPLDDTEGRVQGGRYPTMAELRDKSRPAGERFNNPFNMWFDKYAGQQGGKPGFQITQYDTPAIFPSKMAGAAAAIRKMAQSPLYSGKTMQDLIGQWVGHGTSYAPIIEKETGISRFTRITPAFLKTDQGILFLKTMARYETQWQNKATPLTDEQWRAARDAAFKVKSLQVGVDQGAGGSTTSGGMTTADIQRAVRGDGAAATGGRTATGTGTYTPENAKIVAGASMRGVNPILLEAMKAGSAALPEGYSLRPTSGHRPGDSGFHGRRLASDWQIIGPDGKALPNRGWGATETELHGRVARAAYGWLLKNHPKLAERFEWGGAFPTGKSGRGPPDLMHYDFGGQRGRWFQRQVQRMGPIYPEATPESTRQADPTGAKTPIVLPVRPTTEDQPSLAPLLAKQRMGDIAPKATLDVTVNAPRDAKVEVNGDGAFKGNTSVTRELATPRAEQDPSGGGTIESPA